MSGATIQRKVTAGLKRAAQRAGTGVYQGVILRREANDQTVYPPVLGGETSYACTILEMKTSHKDRDGTDVTQDMVSVMVAPDAEAEPRNGDRLRINGAVYSVSSVEPYRPAGVVLYWIVEAMASGELPAQNASGFSAGFDGGFS